MGRLKPTMLDISAEYRYRGSDPSSAASFRLLIFEFPPTV